MKYRHFLFSYWSQEGEDISLIGNNQFDLSYLLNAKDNLGHKEYLKRGDLYWLENPATVQKCMENLMHDHIDFVELVYIRSGTGIARIGDEEFTVRRGDLLIIPPGIMHATLPWHELYMTNCLIQLSAIEEGRVRLCDEQYRDRIISDYFLLQLSNHSLLNADMLFDMMENEYAMKTVYYRESILHLCNAFMVEICRTLNGVTQVSSNLRFTKTLAYVRENYRTVTLEEAASFANYSKAYFSHLFFKSTGQHFSDFLNQMKIQEARRLLQTTDMSIEEIGEQLGYQSKPFLYRMFKKYTGMTPGELRKRMREHPNSPVITNPDDLDER